jgi:hypothetical protein
LGKIVEPEYLFVSGPKRSSMLICAVLCLIVGLSLALVMIAPGLLGGIL